MASDIRIFVRWKEQTVFAGEDIECTITFKNIANEHPVPPPSRMIRRSSRQASVTGKSAQYVQGRSHGSSQTARLPMRHPSNNRHRPTASLSAALSPGTDSRSPSWSGARGNGAGPGHKHQRSVSIVSLASDDATSNGPSLQKEAATQAPGRSHNRAASLQILPRRFEGGSARPSPVTRHASHYDVPGRLRADGGAGSAAPGRRSSPGTPLMSPPASQNVSRRSTPLSSSFKFPATDVGSEKVYSEPDNVPKAKSINLPKPISREPSPRVPNDQLEVGGQLAPVTRVLSGTSMNGSTRSSAEFYTISNNSSETLASEYLGSHTNPSQRAPAHGRLLSTIPSPQASGNRTLLMGYAQINASFTVDGALIDQSPFEEVKRKGVLGGQGGGGVVGVEKSRSSGGFFGAFGLNNIGESLGGLLNAGELSSIKEMRGVAASKAIPLLSTPQSLLFVDLRLSPGDEKSFKFSFTLPRGLPASYKGKAIKISYNLVIGTQLATSGASSQQQVRRVNVPFRVFSGVNDDGEILGHDLMSPYVILRDDARVEAVRETRQDAQKSGKGKTKSHEASSKDFLEYVDKMLDKKMRRQSSTAMMTSLEAFTSQEHGHERPKSKDAINLAILRSNQTTSGNRSSNRFEIARNGRRVGVIVLNRPFHRLGETVTAAIDFSAAELPCFSLRCTMETSEKVNPAIALRSNASISRVTRRIHASLSENALFATRVVFSPTIPVTSSPTILTSGVSLEWELRFEFATTRVRDNEEADSTDLSILEKIGQDDRGTVLAALETLQAETFEISIPITVYGQVVREPTAEEVVGLEI